MPRNLARGRDFLVASARGFGYPHAQHRLAVAHATGLLGPIPPVDGDRVDAVEEGGGGGELGDELRSLVLFRFAAAGGDVAAAMALGYRCVGVCVCVEG